MPNIVVKILFVVLVPFCIYRGYLEMVALRKLAGLEKDKDKVRTNRE